VMYQKGFSNIFIGIIVGVVLVGIGGYFLLGGKPVLPTAIVESPQVTEEKATVSDEIANWKTYRNEEYGFEFRYPLEWMFVGPSRLEPNNNYKQLLAIGPSQTNVKLSLGIVNRNLNETPDLIFLIHDAKFFLESIQNIGIHGTEAKELIIQNKAVGDTFVDVLIPMGSKTVELWVAQNNKNTLDQILSTFKFIEPPPLSIRTSAG